MNAEQLLLHYERVADAPNAVDRLRQFVLRLALQGKLIEGGGHEWREEAILACLEVLGDGK